MTAREGARLIPCRRKPGRSSPPRWPPARCCSTGAVLAPDEAIRRLTPLQGQHARAPYVALAARLQGFTRDDLEAALRSRSVVKTTIMRLTLHLAAAAEYPAHAQLARQARMRTWRADAHLAHAPCAPR